jgi:hypothetical protein
VREREYELIAQVTLVLQRTQRGLQRGLAFHMRGHVHRREDHAFDARLAREVRMHVQIVVTPTGLARPHDRHASCTDHLAIVVHAVEQRQHLVQPGRRRGQVGIDRFGVCEKLPHRDVLQFDAMHGAFEQRDRQRYCHQFVAKQLALACADVDLMIETELRLPKALTGLADLEGLRRHLGFELHCPCGLLHETGHVHDAVQDVGQLSVCIEHRGVDRAPVALHELATAVGQTDVVALQGHVVGHATVEDAQQ